MNYVLTPTISGAGYDFLDLKDLKELAPGWSMGTGTRANVKKVIFQGVGVLNGALTGPNILLFGPSCFPGS